MIQLFFLKLLKTIFGATGNGKKVNMKSVMLFILFILLISFIFYVKSLKNEVADLSDKNSQMTVQIEQYKSTVKDLNEQISKFKSSEVIDDQVSEKVHVEKKAVIKSKTVIKQKLTSKEETISLNTDAKVSKEVFISEARIDAIHEAYQLALNSSSQLKGS